MPAPASAARMFRAGTTETRAIDGFGFGVLQQAEPRKARQRLSDFVERLGTEFRKLPGGARLDVDHGDVVAGIGERHGDAAAHAAGAETSDRGARGGHWLKPSRNSFCN